MREIKFRAWLKKDSVWNKKGMYGSFTIWDRYDGREESGIYCKDGGDLCEVNAEKVVLMQYTGLKDRNGKEIYEGDIIRILYVDEFKDKERVGAVEWDNEEWGWVITNYDFRYGYAHSDEVIGNIYENPELLEK